MQLPNVHSHLHLLATDMAQHGAKKIVHDLVYCSLIHRRIQRIMHMHSFSLALYEPQYNVYLSHVKSAHNWLSAHHLVALVAKWAKNHSFEQCLGMKATLFLAWLVGQFCENVSAYDIYVYNGVGRSVTDVHKRGNQCSMLIEVRYIDAIKDAMERPTILHTVYRIVGAQQVHLSARVKSSTSPPFSLESISWIWNYHVILNFLMFVQSPCYRYHIVHCMMHCSRLLCLYTYSMCTLELLH